MEIYEQIRTDREAGTRRLVAEYRARLQAAAYLLCADEHEAEDLVFRTFERAILKIDDFRPTGSFYYWIYTILLNFYRMDARKKSARKDSLVKGELPEVEDDGHNLFEEFTFRASAVAVRNAVSRLPDTYREVVVLRYFEDMSTPEIAKVSGIPEGTVRSRLHYAKDALYSMLCDTELSPDFADKLVRATSRKGWLFRKAWILPLLVLFTLGAVAASATVVLMKGSSKKNASPGRESRWYVYLLITMVTTLCMGRVTSVLTAPA
jgi:RNA polymerase sigma-70 factor (ECF subfamily)